MKRVFQQAKPRHNSPADGAQKKGLLGLLVDQFRTIGLGREQMSSEGMLVSRRNPVTFPLNLGSLDARFAPVRALPMISMFSRNPSTARPLELVNYG